GPEIVADHDDGMATGDAVVVRRKSAADSRRGLKHREVVPETMATRARPASCGAAVLGPVTEMFDRSNVPTAAMVPASFMPSRSPTYSQVGASLRGRAPGQYSTKLTRSSGCGTGSVRSISPSMTLKRVVLAPMPRASESTATAVNPGLRRMRRREKRISEKRV